MTIGKVNEVFVSILYDQDLLPFCAHVCRNDFISIYGKSKNNIKRAETSRISKPNCSFTIRSQLPFGVGVTCFARSPIFIIYLFFYAKSFD